MKEVFVFFDVKVLCEMVRMNILLFVMLYCCDSKFRLESIFGMFNKKFFKNDKKNFVDFWFLEY